MLKGIHPAVEARYMAAIHQHTPAAKAPQRVRRCALHERTRQARVVAMTGEVAKYGNLILKNGVISIAA
ncbi:MAG: hypothetical protein NTW21_24075 [Verrucomicrobia bacterium]|nr:hypothetical protein [Verrucomicrobiota bacterium]